MQHYNDNLQLLKAIEFSASKHQSQRRKGESDIPYINHPVSVARILAENGEERNLPLLLAAILHDTIEDTDTTSQEIQDQFGQEVLSIVLEVSDDKSLPKEERKALQISKGPSKSKAAKALKIADKISNLSDILHYPPNWPVERKLQYFDWAAKVVNAIRGSHPTLEALFDETYDKGLSVIQSIKN